MNLSILLSMSMALALGSIGFLQSAHGDALENSIRGSMHQQHSIDRQSGSIRSNQARTAARQVQTSHVAGRSIAGVSPTSSNSSTSSVSAIKGTKTAAAKVQATNVSIVAKKAATVTNSRH